MYNLFHLLQICYRLNLSQNQFSIRLLSLFHVYKPCCSMAINRSIIKRKTHPPLTVYTLICHFLRFNPIDQCTVTDCISSAAVRGFSALKHVSATGPPLCRQHDMVNLSASCPPFSGTVTWFNQHACFCNTPSPPPPPTLRTSHPGIRRNSWYSVSVIPP